MPSGMSFQDNETWGEFLIENLSEGTYSFTLVSRKYTDSEKTQFIGEDRKTVTMTVYSEPQYNGAPGFNIGNMTVGTAITPIDFSELFSGGKAPHTYTVSGTLPQGLTLDSSTGILSGKHGNGVHAQGRGSLGVHTGEHDVGAQARAGDEGTQRADQAAHSRKDKKRR